MFIQMFSICPGFEIINRQAYAWYDIFKREMSSRLKEYVLKNEQEKYTTKII
jgi:hypothetical protein